MFVNVNKYGRGWLFYRDSKTASVYLEEGIRIRVPSNAVYRNQETVAYHIKNAGEIFTIQHSGGRFPDTVLDIDLAWSIISKSRRCYTFDSTDAMLNAFYRYGGHIDREKIALCGEGYYDTSIPLLIAEYGHSSLIIDGNHRMYVALQKGVIMSYYKISRDEMRLLKRSGRYFYAIS